MKIYKIAQNFEMIPQDPSVANDPNVQLQNLQNSQQALQYFKQVVASSETVMASLRELEDNLGIGDIGFRSQVSNTIKAAVQSTPAFNLLAQMNLIASVDNLLDQNELNTIENLIITNISSMSSQYSAQQNAPQIGGAPSL